MDANKDAVVQHLITVSALLNTVEKALGDWEGRDTRDETDAMKAFEMYAHIPACL
jgi:hypothetical protein